jgi:hypothetical protein
MKRIPLAICLFFLSISIPEIARAAAAPVCDVRSFGAKGDGVTLDTEAVKAAIASCVKQGGGTVYFSAGRYVIGTTQLYSHIRLELQSGAVLQGSHDIHDYLPSPPFGFARNYGVDITGEGVLLGMLIAKDAEDVSIEGQGTIDGQSDSFMSANTPHSAQDFEAKNVRDPAKFEAAMQTLEYGPVEPHNRPGTLIVFYHCKNVRVNGIAIHNSPNWTLHLQDVEGAAITGIQIINDERVPNNDGIDCMMCRHVRISDCTIQTGDDGFAIVNSEDINVANCSLTSRSAAIRLESTQIATFTGLTMDTNRGIAVFAAGYSGQSSRPTENVIFSDIAIRTRLIPGLWWGKAEPIYIAAQPCQIQTGASPSVCGVRVRNVTFNNIEAEAENGSLIWGGDGSPIVGVALNNVRLHMLLPNPAVSAGVGGNLDLRWTALTPAEGMIASEIPALYAKKVNGLSLHNFTVDWAGSVPEYFSDAIRVEDFSDLTVDGFSGRQSQPTAGAALFLQDGSGVSITNSRALPGTATFLQMKNVKDRRAFVNYDLKDAKHIIVPATQSFVTQIGAGAVKPRRPRSAP